jgi:hypothetical protein
VVAHNPTPTATPAPSNGPTQDDIDGCVAEMKTSADQILKINPGDNLSLSGKNPVYIKLTGNHPQVDLNIMGDGSVSLPGLCIFVAGNQGSINVNTSIVIKSLYYSGRGNQSAGVINVLQGGSLPSIAADLAGNMATLLIGGPGSHVCPASSLSGHSPSISCTPVE